VSSTTSSTLPVHQLVIPVITTIVIRPVTHSFILLFISFLTITTLIMIIVQSSSNRSLSQFSPITVVENFLSSKYPCSSNHIQYLTVMDVKATCLLTSNFIKMDHNNLSITVQCIKKIVSPCILNLISNNNRIWEYHL